MPVFQASNYKNIFKKTRYKKKTKQNPKTCILSSIDIYICIIRASKRNFARRNKTALGSQGQTETSLKVEDLRSNKTTGKLSSMLYFLCSRMSR